MSKCSRCGQDLDAEDRLDDSAQNIKDMTTAMLTLLQNIIKNEKRNSETFRNIKEHLDNMSKIIEDGIPMSEDKRIKIGVVGVDSGQLVVCDPCYIKHDGTHKELCDYDHLIEKVRKEKDLFNQLHFDAGHDGLGVVFNSGLGDGVYEVWATIGKSGMWGERVKRVEIILIED